MFVEEYYSTCLASVIFNKLTIKFDGFSRQKVKNERLRRIFSRFSKGLFSDGNDFFACEQLLQTESEEVFTSHCDRRRKMSPTTIISSAENHGECPDMPSRRRSDRIFTVPRLFSAFVGTSSM